LKVIADRRYNLGIYKLISHLLQNAPYLF